MDWFHGTWAVFYKDLKLELRSRYAINMLLMFVLASLLLVTFAIGQESVSERVQAALLWVVILFSASIGLGRAFVAEEERGTVLLLQLNTRGSMVYAGKLLFNFLLVLALNVVAVGAFLVLLNVEVLLPGLLLLALVLGALGLSGATTLLAAIIARTANRGPLLPVLLFPLLIPLLLSVVSVTRNALPNGLGWEASIDALLALSGFAGVVITASVLLFDYVWND
ncbi:MAG: heme exporter protein CcmB [Rhodothermales bacterium]